MTATLRKTAHAEAEGPGLPDLTILSGAPIRDTPMRGERRRPLVIRLGKHFRGLFDRLIAGSSLVSNDPVLDMRDFAWTKVLRDNWEAIRAEAERAARGRGAAPSLAVIPSDHRAVAEVDQWRPFFLWGHGYPVEGNLAECPETARLLKAVPGLSSAFFSILAPGTHIPDHRGVTKALITCHLGLVVPRSGDVRMRIDHRTIRWAEGETLVFDDTYRHEVWNDADEPRVVLLVQFARPLRQPGRWIATTFLDILRRSAFVQEARANIAQWNAAMAQLDV